jgi:hypothetical protein
VEFICVDDNNEGQLTQDDLQALNDAANGIQRAQRITGKHIFLVLGFFSQLEELPLSSDFAPTMSVNVSTHVLHKSYIQTHKAQFFGLQISTIPEVSSKNSIANICKPKGSRFCVKGATV